MFLFGRVSHLCSQQTALLNRLLTDQTASRGSHRDDLLAIRLLLIPIPLYVVSRSAPSLWRAG